MSEQWAKTTLGDIAEWGSGGTPKAGDPKFYEGGTIPWAVIGDVQDGPLSETSNHITPAGAQAIGHVAPAGAVLVTMYGTVGRVALTTREMATNQAIAWGVPDAGRVLPGFLFLWLRNHRPDLERQARGATQRNVNRKIIRDTPILLPPLPVQRRIVDVMAHLDNHIANLRAEQEVLEALLVGARDEILAPQTGWMQTVLGGICTKIGSGATPRGGESSYRADGVSLIRSQNVYDLSFEMKGLAHIDPDQARLLDSVTVEDGDILLNITGASVNRCCVVPTEVLPARVNQHVAIIRAKREQVRPDFLVHLLRRSDNLRHLDRMAGAGTTRQALTKRQIEEFVVSFPDLGEQARLAGILDAIIGTAASLEAEVEALSVTRRVLLSALIGGNLRLPKTYDSLLPEVA